jgi:hypothetical protein
MTPDANPELILLKQRQLQLRRRRLAAVKDNGLAFYKPHPKQDAFHNAGLRYKRRMVRAGNRFGKSQMGCAEDVAWLLGERLWYPENHLARRGGIPQFPVKLLTITTDWDKVDEIWTSERGEGGKVWKYMPKGFRKGVKRNHSGAIDTIECANGALWRFDTVKSYMANPAGSESSDWDAIHFDEPLPQGMHKAVTRGLIDRNGAEWFTLTMLTEFWINDYFFPQDTGGKIRDDVWAITGSIYDNIYLPREAIDNYVATLTEDEKTCRRDGIPLHLSGLIYKSFAWDKHVLRDPPRGWSSWCNPPSDYTIYYAIDTHPRTPHAVLFLAVSPLGQLFFFHDIFKHCKIAELANDIHGIIDGRFVVAAKLEPAAYIEDQNTDRSLATDFLRAGINVTKAVKDLKRGILAVKSTLSADPQNVWFSPSCARTLWEIQRYAWDAETDKPLDVDDHMMENMYRLIIEEPRWLDRDKASGMPVEDIAITRAETSTYDLEFTLD